MTHNAPNRTGFLPAHALADLAAGGTDPDSRADPVALTTDASMAALTLAGFIAEYGGRLTIESPEMVVTCPHGSPASAWSWARRLRQALLISCGLDPADGPVVVDDWTIVVGGAS